MRTVTLDGLGAVMPVASNARNTQLYGFGAPGDAEVTSVVAPNMVIVDKRTIVRGLVIAGVVGLAVGGISGYVLARS